MEKKISIFYTQQKTIKYDFTAEIPKENNTGRNWAFTIQLRGFQNILVHLSDCGLANISFIWHTWIYIAEDAA